MPDKRKGTDLFIVDNSDSDWKVKNYLHDWAELADRFDIATGYFEIGALLALDGQWQKLDHIRILMGDEVSKRTRRTILVGIDGLKNKLDDSLEREKESNDFLRGVPAIVDAFRSGKIQCRVYTKDKFHAKAYITHGKLAVVGSVALVGSSNFTYPGLTENVELNVQIQREVSELQETVWINKDQTAGFNGVPEAVWNFHIGGYQVCEKWLKDRKGRTLSQDDINHYQKIIVALSETIRIMEEIDEVIDQHGGWPGAFITKPLEIKPETGELPFV